MPEKLSFRYEQQSSLDYLKNTFEQVKEHLSKPEQEVFYSLVLPYQKETPKMEEFDYHDAAQDKALLQKIQNAARPQYEKDETQKINYVRGKICEALLAYLIEQYWMPSSLYFTETAEFDDWINGVDAIIEIENSPEKGAVVDFTTATKGEVLAKKFNTILQKIDKGTLAEIKYFKSQQDNKCYYLKMVPAIIIAIDVPLIQELSGLYMQKQTKKLSGHWFKYALFDEILSQTNYFKNYILNPRRKNYKAKTSQLMAQKYEALKNAIENLKENPLSSLKEGGVNIDDLRKELCALSNAYKNIIERTTSF